MRNEPEPHQLLAVLRFIQSAGGEDEDCSISKNKMTAFF